MQGFSWIIIRCFLVLAILCHSIFAMPSVRVKGDDELQLNDQSAELNPIEIELTNTDGLDREKRKLPDATFAAKNAVLGFVFGGSKSSAGPLSAGASAQASLGASGASATRPLFRLQAATSAPITTTTDDTPDFDRGMVSLDIPDQLFSNSFTTVTKVSNIVGDLMMNSARRYAQFLNYFKPLLGKTLTLKGYQPTTTTTTESPTTTDDTTEKR